MQPVHSPALLKDIGIGKISLYKQLVQNLMDLIFK
tara:strand:+ start:468 stop:572 length:105 start_codon:yes stop_codon:yes gene_type:complete